MEVSRLRKFLENLPFRCQTEFEIPFSFSEFILQKELARWNITSYSLSETIANPLAKKQCTLVRLSLKDYLLLTGFQPCLPDKLGGPYRLLLKREIMVPSEMAQFLQVYPNLEAKVRSPREPEVKKILQEARARTDIPAFLHFIWVGPKPLPEYVTNYLERYVELHASWLILLWRDEDVEEQDLVPPEVAAKIRTIQVYASKADVLRVHLLGSFGGVYLDTDMEPRNSLSALVGLANALEISFVGCHEVATYYPKILSNGFLISRAQDPLMQQTLKEAMKADVKNVKKVNETTGPHCLGRSLFQLTEELRRANGNPPPVSTPPSVPSTVSLALPSHSSWRYLQCPTSLVFSLPMCPPRKFKLSEEQKNKVYLLHQWKATWLEGKKKNNE